MLEIKPEPEGRPGDGVEVKREELRWQPAQFVPVVTYIIICLVLFLSGRLNLEALIRSWVELQRLRAYGCQKWYGFRIRLDPPGSISLPAISITLRVGRDTYSLGV